MDLKHHTHPDQLEQYSFIWSELRLVIASVALFLGGVPPVYKIFGYASWGIINPLLTICWIISGVAAVYLLYRWYHTGQKLFGAKNDKDTVSFLVMAVSGINLGLAGLIRVNIGMRISTNYAVFVIVGIIYLACAAYLHGRWTKHGQKLF